MATIKLLIADCSEYNPGSQLKLLTAGGVVNY